MITKWQYNDVGGQRPLIKDYIRMKQLRTIDLGGSAYLWSYPECNTVVDAYPPQHKDCLYFNIDFDNENTWTELLDYISKNGKFDFSICSHTLEDVCMPSNLMKLLEKVSKAGFIAVPSKYDECCKLYSNQYRGNAHHKQFFDIKEDTLILYPKFSWIEVDSRSDVLVSLDKGRELSFFWEDTIPLKIFGNGKPFRSDDELINYFYNELTQ